MRNKINHILYFLLFVTGIQAQSLSAFRDATNAAIEDKDYYNAFYYSRLALEFDESNLELIDLHAESARLFDAYTVADSLYQKIVEEDNNQSFPLAPYYLAQMQFRVGKYDEARSNFEIFLSEYDGADETFIQQSNKSIRAIEWAQSMLDSDDKNIVVERYGGDVNSPFSEFGAIVQDEDLYYSSLRFEDDDDQYNPSKLKSKIISEEQELSTLNSNQPNLHTAHTSFTNDGKRMFYTLCQYENSYDIRCDIFFKEVLTDSTFGPEIKLGDEINMSMYTSTQPCVAYNSTLDQEVLYFSSDRPGGKGKMDIWFSLITEEGFSTPRNLSAVNSIENEITPFYHSNTDKLYFSSDGYLSLGGYDIYQLDNPLESKELPINLGLPTNSSFNDIYYFLNEEGDQAHFSSNRIGSMYLEDSFEACCYDIYKADIKVTQIELNALTFESASGDSLEGVKVCILDGKSGDLIDEFTNLEGIDHIFLLDLNKDYKVVAKKDGYITETIVLNTNDVPPSGKIQRKLFLTKETVSLDLTVFDKETLNPLNGASITIECMNDPSRSFTRSNVTGNDFIVELERDCNYRITIHRDGYEPQVIVVNASDPDIEGYVQRKVYLSKDNAKYYEELANYLPVKVYYDNDDPERRNFTLHSNTNYSDSYYPYYAKKDEFKRKYTANQKGDLKYSSAQEVDRFFEDELKVGYEKLQVFTSKLLENLQAGNTLELTIRGFASPRATKKYNLALGQRRISNVINELRDYGDGALIPFIENGQLVFKQISYGEEMSDGKVSDSYPNRRLSVYSPQASRERKTELVEINKLND